MGHAVVLTKTSDITCQFTWHFKVHHHYTMYVLNCLWRSLSRKIYSYIVHPVWLTMEGQGYWTDMLAELTCWRAMMTFLWMTSLACQRISKRLLLRVLHRHPMMINPIDFAHFVGCKCLCTICTAERMRSDVYRIDKELGCESDRVL